MLMCALTPKRAHLHEEIKCSSRTRPPLVTGYLLARSTAPHVLEAGCTHDAAAPCRVLLDTVRRSRMS